MWTLINWFNAQMHIEKIAIIQHNWNILVKAMVIYFSQFELLKEVGELSGWWRHKFTANYFMAQMVKNLPIMQETWVGSLGRDDLLEKEWPLNPVFLPGEFHGQRRLVDYSTWGRKQSDMTEWLTLSLHLISERRNNFSIGLLSTYIVLYWFCHFVLAWVKEMPTFFC